MRFQVDRFEDNGWAVLIAYPLASGRRTFDVPREALPPEAAPGDVYDLSFELDQEETDKLARENKRLMDELLDRDQR